LTKADALVLILGKRASSRAAILN